MYGVTLFIQGQAVNNFVCEIGYESKRKEERKSVMMSVVCSSSCMFKKSRPGFGFGQSQQPLVMKKESGVPPPPPRRLILLRHAKSCCQDRSLKDHDRPLSKDGESDVIQVAYKLQQLAWIPQLILSSDARRTRQTLEIMQEHVPALLEAEVHFISSFYSVAAMDGQTAHHLQRAISNYATDDILTVMCVGHNRGWEEAASTFSGVSVELNTCNAALLEAAAAGKSWEEAFLLAGHGGWKLQQLVKPNVTP